MLKKLNDLSTLGYAKLRAFFMGLKNDERGLSGVVVAVLLILVAVLAVVLIWGFLSGWLQRLFNQIINKADEGLQ